MPTRTSSASLLPARRRPTGAGAALILAVILLTSAASDAAFARHSGRSGSSGSRHSSAHRAAIGVMFVAPAFWYFRTPVYAPPLVIAPVVAPASPPVYIERGDAQSASIQSAGEWWYYCAQSSTYYPYVKECAGEWQRVAAEPPANR